MLVFITPTAALQELIHILGNFALIKVAIVDDHPVIRLALRHTLQAQNDIQFAGEAKDAKEALDLVRATNLNVLILDIDLPGRSGIDVLKLICRQAPDLQLVIFTNYPDDPYALMLFRLGISAYISKCSEIDTLMSAVRAAASGRRWISPSQSELLASSTQKKTTALHDELTHREMQVLLKLARGIHPKEIAEDLALSMKSVSTYRTRLLRKLEITSNGEMTYYTLKHKLLD